MKTLLQLVRSFWKLLAVIAIVVVAHLFMVQMDWRWDMTEAQIYSLSDRSIETVQKLNRPLTLYFFYTERTSGIQDPARIRRLLQEYARRSQKVSFREIDIARNPNMAKKYNVQNNGVIVLESGEKTKNLNQRALYTFQRRGRRRPSRQFQGEQAITRAIIKLTESTDRVVYFSTGHGEYQKQLTRGQRSVAAWAQALRDVGFGVKSWNPLTDNLPDTRNLIVTLDPTRSFSRGVVDQFNRWINQGGKLIVGVSPESSKRMNPLVEPVGITFKPRQIIDPARRSQASLFNPFVFVPKLKNHPVLNSLEEKGVLVQFGRSAPMSLSSGTLGDTPTEILTTSAEAFSKPIDRKVRAEFNPKTDRKGPFTVGAVWSGEDGAKVVGLGNVSFVSNRMFSKTGNKNFALNLVNWIFERQVSLSIRPTPSDYNKVTVTATQSRWIQVIALGVIPLFILTWGGLVWWKRRNL